MGRGIVASVRPNPTPPSLPTVRRCKQSRAKKPECGAHIRTKPALRHAELLSIGPMPANSKHLVIFVVLVLKLPLVMIRRRSVRPRHEGFSLTLLPALSLNHKRPTKGRASARRKTGRPLKTGAPDTEETRKNDEQEIQEQGIRINAVQQH